MRLAQITGVTNPSSVFTTSQFFPTNLASRFLEYAILGAGMVFFVQLLIAGFNYMTAAGDPGKVQSATKGLTNAAIGLFVVLTTFFIIQILQTIFGLTII